MLKSMLRACLYLKIFKSIIRLDAVDMVNNFMLRKRSFKMILHDLAMLKDALSRRIPKVNVAVEYGTPQFFRTWPLHCGRTFPGAVLTWTFLARFRPWLKLLTTLCTYMGTHWPVTKLISTGTVTGTELPVMCPVKPSVERMFTVQAYISGHESVV